MNVPELERQICRIGVPVFEKAVWVLFWLFLVGALYVAARVLEYFLNR